MGGMGMHGNQMAGNMMNMPAQEQMHLMSLLEEQARMMAQFMPGMMSPAVNPAFQNGNQQGGSLLDRVEPKLPTNKPFNQPPKPMNRNADNMDTAADGAAEGGDSNTPCHFNKRCTRKDCPYAHQSPAAPEGTPIDFNDICSFGAACKNRKCTGRHPSPAVKTAHQAEEFCKFFPHCTNPSCPFKHPSMPLCRNGASCSVVGCKFTHVQVPCKFNPCLNPSCPYKHAEGQRGAFPDKVWTAESGEGNAHVSERKFADEGGDEELIKPDNATDGSQSQEIIT